MDVSQILKHAEEGMIKAVEHAAIEFNKIRTGRASTSMLDAVQVDYYGTPTPLAQVASLATPDATVVTVQPWEKAMLEPIERAINAANLGLTPNNDGTTIRLPIPPLTEERRRDIAKQAKAVAEESKVGVRNARREAMESLKKAEKDEHLSEDLRRDAENDVQELTDRYVTKVDDLFKAKEKDIMTV